MDIYSQTGFHQTLIRIVESDINVKTLQTQVDRHRHRDKDKTAHIFSLFPSVSLFSLSFSLFLKSVAFALTATARNPEKYIKLPSSVYYVSMAAHGAVSVSCLLCQRDHVFSDVRAAAAVHCSDRQSAADSSVVFVIKWVMCIHIRIEHIQACPNHHESCPDDTN